jgi:hypothetical protein
MILVGCLECLLASLALPIGFAVMTEFFGFLMFLPVAAISYAAYRAYQNWGEASRILLKGFFAGGVALLILSLVGVAQLFGYQDPKTLDIAVKAGAGMLIAALVCAVLERDRSRHQA